MWWQSWVHNLLLTAAAALLFWGGWGFGTHLLRLFGSLPMGRLERTVLSAGLGLGALSFVLLFLGMAGLFQPEAFLTLIALLLLAAVLAPRESRAIFPNRIGRALAGEEKVLLAFLGGGVVLTWLTTLPPPVFYDALMYHLGVPNLYLIHGGIENLPHVVHSYFPFGVEMLYLLGIWMGGLQLAGLVNFGLGLLAAMTLAALAMRYWGRQRALMAVTLYLLSPMAILLSRYASSENGLSFYFLLTVLCLYRWREDGREGWLLLAGIYGGLAFGTKYVGGLFGVLLPSLFLVFLALHGGAEERVRRALRALGVFLCAAAAVSLPWLVKNALFTGNPFYPTFTSLFGPASWVPEQARMLAGSAHALWAGDHSWKDLLLLPWNLAFGGDEFGAASKGNLILGLFLPAAAVLVLKVKDGRARALTLLLGAYFVLWATTFWMARFLLPFSALGSIVIILALTGKNPSRGRLRAVTALVVTALLLHGAVLFRDEPTRRTFRPALGLESGDEYLRGLLRVYPAVEFINRALPADARILVLGETRVAYLERDHLFQSVFDRPLVDALVGGQREPDAIVASLKEEGLTHVLLNLAELERLERARRGLPFSKEILRALLDHLRSRGDLLLSDNRVYLFRL